MKIFAQIAFLLIALLSLSQQVWAVTPKVAAGSMSNCALDDSGLLRCWGDDSA